MKKYDRIPISVCGEQFLINIHKEDELLSNIIREQNVYTRNDLLIFKKLLNLGDYFIDVGANIGWHTIFGSLLVGDTGKVFAFEPNVINYKVLESNIELNNLSNVSAINLALSNFIGPSKLYCSKNNYGDHIMITVDHTLNRDSEDITSTTLDQFISNNDIDAQKIKLIKMDIQGSEALALAGMQQFIKKYKPPIILEYAPLHLKLCESSPFDIMACIDKYDYIPFLLHNEIDIPEDNIITPMSIQSLIETTNYLFTTEGWGVDLLLVQKQHLPLI